MDCTLHVTHGCILQLKPPGVPSKDVTFDEFIAPPSSNHVGFGRISWDTKVSRDSSEDRATWISSVLFGRFCHCYTTTSKPLLTITATATATASTILLLILILIILRLRRLLLLLLLLLILLILLQLPTPIRTIYWCFHARAL